MCSETAIFRKMQIRAMMTYTITNSPDVLGFFFNDKNKFCRMCRTVRTHTYCSTRSFFFNIFYLFGGVGSSCSIPELCWVVRGMQAL